MARRTTRKPELELEGSPIGPRDNRYYILRDGVSDANLGSLKLHRLAGERLGELVIALRFPNSFGLTVESTSFGQSVVIGVKPATEQRLLEFKETEQRLLEFKEESALYPRRPS